MSLRLRDLRRGLVDVPVTRGHPLRVGFVVSDDVDETVARAVHADLVRRAAERDGAVAAVSPVGPLPDLVARLLMTVNCRPPAQSDVALHVVVGDDGPAESIVCAPRSRRVPTDGGGLAVRLALLADDLDVRDAATELDRWRTAVASWAEHPSKPMCADYVAWCAEAVSDDLGLARVVRLMRDVEQHPELPPGSKFETFAHLDGLVGLDLAALVGLSR